MRRKIIYYSILSVIGLLMLYFLYCAIGYCVLGAKSPVLYNGTKAYFMGMYLMGITYGVIFLIFLTIVIILLCKRKKILKIDQENKKCLNKTN